MLLFRAIVPVASSCRLIWPLCKQFHPRVPVLSSSPSPSLEQVRFGSMKVKRIQRKQPLEKNRIRRVIKGTKLEVKKQRKKKIRNTDPSKYMTIKPVEFDPWDIRGRSTLTVSTPLLLKIVADSQGSSIYARDTWHATSSTPGSLPPVEGWTRSQTDNCQTEHRRQKQYRQDHSSTSWRRSQAKNTNLRLSPPRTRAADRRSNRI
jgi:hypothetical protein